MSVDEFERIADSLDDERVELIGDSEELICRVRCPPVQIDLENDEGVLGLRPF
jgi:hypothetical protein